MTGWMERVIVQVNPQVPAYFVALPHPVSRLLGQPYEKALEKLASLPMLRIPPSQRLASLIAGGEER
jgi:hypothetical protein